jgi:quercetin dioxygenase-like cupin family protein
LNNADEVSKTKPHFPFLGCSAALNTGEPMKTFIRNKATLFLRLAPLLLCVVGLHSESALAKDDYALGLAKDRISVKTLLPLMPSKTIIGQDYPYPNGTPLIESYLIELPPGQKTGIHLHQVPLLAYIISGRLETHYGTKGSKVSNAGDIFIEAIDWCHFGQTLGTEPVRILAIYLNSVGGTQKKSVDCAALQ